jgi:ribosomal protein L20A (L18A)
MALQLRVQLRVQLWSVNQRTTEAKLRYQKMSSEVRHCSGIAIVESCYQVWTSESRLRRLSVE